MQHFKLSSTVYSQLDVLLSMHVYILCWWLIPDSLFTGCGRYTSSSKEKAISIDQHSWFGLNSITSFSLIYHVITFGFVLHVLYQTSGIDNKYTLLTTNLSNFKTTVMFRLSKIGIVPEMLKKYEEYNQILYDILNLLHRAQIIEISK